MSMSPENYVGIEVNYNELIPRVKGIVSFSNPVTFLEECIKILPEIAELSKLIEMGYNDRKESKVKDQYLVMLNNIQSLKEELMECMLKK